MATIEREVRARGFRSVAGVDEVGRGALFGSVFAAAVILSPDRPVRGLNDSKQLDPERREVLAERIRERAVAWAVAAVDAATIDRINIYQASRARHEAGRRKTAARRRLPAHRRALSGRSHRPARADSRRRPLPGHRRGVDPGQSRARRLHVRMGRGRIRSTAWRGTKDTPRRSMPTRWRLTDPRRCIG